MKLLWCFAAVLGSLFLHDSLRCFASPLYRAPKPDRILPIQRVEYSHLTYHSFYTYFRQRDRPVIITGIPLEQSICFGDQNATYNDTMLRDCKGDVRVDRMVPGIEARKGVQRFAHLSFDAFMRMFSQEGAFDRRFGDVEPIMATTSSAINDHCKKLWQRLRFPAYFTGEICLVPGTSGWPCSRFPQIYFSQKGSRQTFHTDTAKTEMWSAVCRGRKRYYVVPITEIWAKLGKDINLPKSLLRPEEWPLGLPIWEGVLEVGEVLYLPAGAMHAVRTEEDTINIIDNFIDAARLGPLSSVNIELMKSGERHPYGIMLEWLSRDDFRTDVYDEGGKVVNPNCTANGFPSWGSLASWIGRNHRLSTGGCDDDGFVQCAA